MHTCPLTTNLAAMESRIVYDRDFLLQLNPKNNELAPLLNPSEDEDGSTIFTPSLKLRKRCRIHRGKRGGRRKQRHIQVILSPRKRDPNHILHKANHENLIHVRNIDLSLPNARCALLMHTL